MSKILHASKILSIIGLKERIAGKKNRGEKKSKTDWSLEVNQQNVGLGSSQVKPEKGPGSKV